MSAASSPPVNLVFTFSSYPLKERLASKLCANYARWLGGFRTFETRSVAGRGGFELEPLGGPRVVLASKQLLSAVSFNKYGLALDAFDVTALGALNAAAAAGRVLVLDELGPMALKSEKFSARVIELLFSLHPCLVFHRRGAAVFEDVFARLENTAVMELSEAGWAAAVTAAEAWLDALIVKMER
ncbi:MAG TPA: nucleoside-triphosphatase [Elusimicrobiales bacterium]|nr:nucleoside-triphosphatase [Elusimicrobiales bacterium]